MSTCELVRPLWHLRLLAAIAGGLIGCDGDDVVESDLGHAETTALPGRENTAPATVEAVPTSARTEAGRHRGSPTGAPGQITIPVQATVTGSPIALRSPSRPISPTGMAPLAKDASPASTSFLSGPAAAALYETSAGQIGIPPFVSLEELYEFLQAQPSPEGNWTPISEAAECSRDWVVWTPGPDDPGDPDPPPELRVCLGRWRATNSDRCRDQSLCGCEQYNQCFSGRRAVDSCDLFPGVCSQVVFQKNVPSDRRIAENLNCRLQTRDIARNASDGGPYHYRMIVTQGGGFDFVCNAQYMVTPRRLVNAPECGCQTAGVCTCATEQLASAVTRTQQAGVDELTAQTDPEDALGPATCETLQEQASLSPQARHDALTAGLATGDPQSHSAFEYTLRLMHELDMVRPTAAQLVGSSLAVPQCGVIGWLSVAPTCAAEVPPMPLAASNNCARLLSSHVRSTTITEEVFRRCTDALRTISVHAYTDPACVQDVKSQVAAFATALRDKAIGLAVSAIASQEIDR